MTMMTERDFQSTIIKWLKDQGAYVVKPPARPGVPVGCPDILFFYKDRWGAIECKKSETAPFRPGQQATLKYLRAGNPFVYAAYPENIDFILNELDARFF